MMSTLRRLPGTPYRVRRREPDRAAEEKIEIEHRTLESVLPVAVRIEVEGGRSSTASAMRANRVARELEDVGGTARTVELEGSHAVLEGEADREQAAHVARLPFVRRIRLPS